MTQAARDPAWGGGGGGGVAVIPPTAVDDDLYVYGDLFLRSGSSWVDVLAGLGVGVTAAPYLNIKAPPYNATGNGTTDDTAAWNAALADVPNGGTIVFPPGFTYRGAFVLNTNKRIRVVGYGATLKPLNSGIAFKVNQGDGATIAGCNVEGFVIDGTGVTSPTGMQLLNTDRTILRDLRIKNCATGLELKADAGGWVEEWALMNTLIDACTTGISFNKTATGQGSFGESMLLNVGVNNCTTGLTANSGSSLYRTLFTNLVFWLANSQTGMVIDGNVVDANWFCSFETLGSGTSTVGVSFTSNAQSTHLANLQFSFTGSVATKVQTIAGKPVTWRQSTSDVYLLDGAARGLRVFEMADTFPRFTVATGFSGGGGVLFGQGGGTDLDVTLYRYQANLLATDDDFRLSGTSRVIQIMRAADSQPYTQIEEGKVQFGIGGSTAVDTNLYRTAANALQTDDQFRATDGVQGKYLSGAGKTTVVDADFTVTPTNGMTAVHYDTTAGKAYISVRANGAWKVMAGPV